jgi:hypothetical protein
MMAYSLLHGIFEYLIIGIGWAVLVEYLDSRRSSSKLKKSITTRLILVLLWPATVFIAIVNLLRNLIHK